MFLPRLKSGKPNPEERTRQQMEGEILLPGKFKNPGFDSELKLSFVIPVRFYYLIYKVSDTWLSVCGCVDFIWNPYLILFVELSLFATRLLNLLDHPPGSDMTLELCTFRGQLPTFKLETAFSWFLSPIFGVTLGVFGLSSHQFMTRPRAWAHPQNTPILLAAGASLPPYRIKRLRSVLEIPPILTLEGFSPWKAPRTPKCYTNPVFVQFLLFLAWVQAATSSWLFLPNNSLCEVSCVVWLYGIPWFPTARVPFHLHCNAYSLSNS